MSLRPPPDDWSSEWPNPYAIDPEDTYGIPGTYIDDLRSDYRYNMMQKRLDEMPKRVNLNVPAKAPSSCLRRFPYSGNEQSCSSSNIFRTAHFEMTNNPCAKSENEYAQITGEYEEKMDKLRKDFVFRLMNQMNKLECLKRQQENNRTNQNDEGWMDDKIFLFSKPGVPYTLEMKYGEKVHLATKWDRSQFAISVQDCDIHRPSLHFSRICRFRVKARKLTYVEGREVLRRYNLMGTPEPHAYVLEFESFKEREIAARNIYLEDAHVAAVGAIDFLRTFNFVSVEVVYNRRWLFGPEAKIVLEDPCEFDFACRALTLNGVRCHIVSNREKNLISPTAKYDGSVPMIFLYESEILTEEDLQSFIGKILDANNVRTKSVEFVKVRADWRNGYQQGGRLFAEMIEHFDSMVRNPRIDQQAQPKLVRQIKRLELGRGHEEKNGFKACFSDASFTRGVKIAEKFDNNYRQSFVPEIQFQRNNGKAIYAESRIKKCFPISKKVRLALDKSIWNFDVKIRQKATEQVVNPRFSTPHLHVKIVEHWRGEEEVGLIGVQGWNLADVNEEIFYLEAILQPVVLDCEEQRCEDLLYGAGEIYAKQCLRSYESRVVADFDKFSRKIFVYGDEAQSAVNDLKDFKEIKKWLLVKVMINISDLYAAENFVQTFLQKMSQEISKDLNCVIFHHNPLNTIEFEGSLFALDTFITIINNGFVKFSECLDKHTNVTCPVCMNTMPDDMYRLKKCGHVYCRVCINNMVRNAIESESIPVRCLCEGCNGFVSPSDFEELVLGGENRLKELDCQKIKKLSDSSISVNCKDPRSKHRVCPTADCAGIIENKKTDPSTASSSTERLRMECTQCRKVYCPDCIYLYHPETTCEVEKRLQNSPQLAIDQFMKENESRVKRCPECSTIIEKNGGCHHISCQSCKIHFCWLCRYKNEDAGEIYKHMQEVHQRYSDEFDENGVANPEA